MCSPGHSDPAAGSSLCRGCVLGAVECRDFIPEQRRLQHPQRPQSELQSPCSSFSKCSHLFYFVSELPLAFFLFCCHVWVCSSLLWLQQEAGSPDPWALPAVPLAGWLFIAFLSLNCRSVESFATAFWRQNSEIFTDRQNLIKLEIDI